MRLLVARMEKEPLEVVPLFALGNAVSATRPASGELFRELLTDE